MIGVSVEKRPATVNGVKSEWSPRLLTVFDSALLEKGPAMPASIADRGPPFAASAPNICLAKTDVNLMPRDVPAVFVCAARSW
jgi:hypothetical protein